MIVAAVFKNSDFTEGRGPMHLHLIFADKDIATAYVQGQRGIFDGPQPSEPRVYGDTESWNGYDVKMINVITSADDLIQRAADETLKNEDTAALRARLAKIEALALTGRSAHTANLIQDIATGRKHPGKV